ncbi:MAG: pyridoxal phosphate-dependent aminotransferase, partial [Planctomycetes bacterium]|nr:pyridoxal phosphate-dependent aminotransferase [Planctomycetota bacterium]
MFKPRPLRDVDAFHYMHLAKMLEGSTGTFLSGSTMVQPSREELDLREADFDFHALADAYGDPRAINILSDRFGVPASEITMTAGSSEANALLYQALLEPGDEVIAECPGYEVFWLLPKLYHASVKLLPRRESRDFVPDIEELKALLGPKTRLLVLTDLHNPTNAKIPADALKAIIKLCAENGTWVLVDEVYLDHLEAGTHDRTSYHYGENVIVTSSLTKVYGLGVLRCGWCFAPEELSARLLELIDLTTVCMPAISMNLGVR